MRVLKVLGLCIGAALVCAFVFVAMLHFSLPPSDGAYGLSIAELLSDPFVFLWCNLWGRSVWRPLIPICLLLDTEPATTQFNSLSVRRGARRNSIDYTVCGMGWSGGVYTRARLRSARLSALRLEVACSKPRFRKLTSGKKSRFHQLRLGSVRHLTTKHVIPVQ
jgi:hypothetical protein